MQFIRNYKNSV